MFIGYDFLGMNNGSIVNTELFQSNYNKLIMKKGIYDEIYIEEYTDGEFVTDKPIGWSYRSVLDAKFQNNLEAGSVSGNGMQITAIKFQKRRNDELVWKDVAQINYDNTKQILYTAQDKIIQNGETYQYSLIPLTTTIQGDRVLSENITVDFEGVYLSDKDHNYKLFYNIEYGDIDYNHSSAVLEPLNSKYPIVTYSTLDYRKSNLTALFLSKVTEQNNYRISMINERKEKDELFNFLKNNKPKIFRSETGDFILMTIVDSPKEMPNKDKKGIANIQFNYVEIGDANNNEDLRSNNLLEGLEVW